MYSFFTSALFRQYAVVVALNLNCLSVGLGSTWASPVLVKLANSSETVLRQPLTSDDASWIGSIVFIAAAVGFLIAYALIDYIGRKRCAILSAIFSTSAAILCLVATKVWMIVLGRAVNGLFQGIILGVVPVYASEVASKEVRGSLGVMLQIFSSLGAVIMLSVGPYVSYFNLNLMVTVFVIVTSIPTIFLPDSPSFLFSKGKIEESKKVLIFLRSSEPQANEELKAYSANRRDKKLNPLTAFLDKMFLKSLIKPCSIGFLMFFTGYNCVETYLQTILEVTRTSVRSEMASGIIGAIQLIASFSTMMLTDRFGRKPILVTTLIGFTVGMVGLGTFFKLTETGSKVSGFLNFLPLISLIIIVYCYSAGPSSLFWVLISELFDDRTRGIGSTTAFLTCTIPGFLTIRYYSSLVASIGAAATFWISGTISVVLAGFIAWGVPETNGKNFSEIQNELGNRDIRDEEK
ncbi:facilitated trehalose transporter Tret1-like [Leguminivora glycinivorella]|uniref:facilitated trehalose transporter Tret1-like n=1 Tax=Leguminivora glycinivorella TaxID=1035111 RepID=UPI00200ECDF7|nr:facilitated trehalose transporter Tret1-like [Leguminivora glycinivorella]